MYVPHGCVSICLTLPTTRRSHQLDSILRVGQYIGKKNPNQLRMRIDCLGLIEVLKDARDGHLDGNRYRLVHYPDWNCLGSVLATEAPGHQNACIACPVSCDDCKRYGFDTQAERSLRYHDIPLRSFLDLLESLLHVGYHVSHCVKDVVINMGLHGMNFRLQDHNPALVPELRSIFMAHTKEKSMCHHLIEVPAKTQIVGGHHVTRYLTCCVASCFGGGLCSTTETYQWRAGCVSGPHANGCCCRASAVLFMRVTTSLPATDILLTKGCTQP